MFFSAFFVVSKNIIIFANRKSKQRKGHDMSTTALNGLYEYLTSTLSTSNMLWLSTRLAEYAKNEEENLKPYTMEELNARIDEAERQIAAGEVQDFDEAMDEIEKELAVEEIEMAEAV